MVVTAAEEYEPLKVFETDHVIAAQLGPKSAAEFAFLLHGFHYLNDEGVMAIILPHGTRGTLTPSSACRRTCSIRPASRSASS